ncbi:hypothetical protein OK411_13715 [Pseudomonas sp. RG1]|uniref:hypothetical protein n=1 Tax=Pseudomonas sp. RG1 TaxID=2981602 RepID=UPI00221F1EAD|nr:hypothetical protein [Pseudomonas sp. RG1]MCW0921440.1 hypothetical protein [Pseudomonas sp. RG1]
MRINLSPMRMDATLSVIRSGNAIVVNGEEFDFSRVAEGDTLPSVAIKSTWFAGDVSRVDGELELTLILPLPINYSPEQAFPSPLEDVRDGPIPLPMPLPEPGEQA